MQARQILVDVVEDFATVEGVMERFEQWKEEDGDSYNDAYVSLCLPKVSTGRGIRLATGLG